MSPGRDMDTIKHPCGSLPVCGLQVSATYCVAHETWTATVYRWYQGGDCGDKVQDLQQMQFGPFDTEEDVRAWILRAILQMSDVLP